MTDGAMDKNTNHPATLLSMKDALESGTPVTLKTTAGSVEARRVRNGQGLTVTFHPQDGSKPLSVTGLTPEQADAVKWMLGAVDDCSSPRRWRFAYDEENGRDGTFRGVVTDGERFLFFRTWEDPDTGAEMRGIYNSILMGDDTEECRYEADPENDSLLLDCLDSLEDPRDYCGDGSPIQTLEFRDILRENSEAGGEAARECLLLPQVVNASYDARRDCLDIVVRNGTLGESPRHARNESASVHLCPDFGYYTVLYQTGRGPLTFGGMFDSNDGVAEEISGYPFIHEKEPEWLVPLLEACQKAGRDPSWMKVVEEDQIP